MRKDINPSLEERTVLTSQIYASPYNPQLYLRRAVCHEALGFADLSAGDAYRALLLTDDVLDDFGEYHEQAIETLQAATRHPDAQNPAETVPFGHTLNVHLNQDTLLFDHHVIEPFGASAEKPDGPTVKELAQYYAQTCLVILARTLRKCGCLKSAYSFSSRGLGACPGHQELGNVQNEILESYRQSRLQREPLWDPADFNPMNDLPEQGSVRRELYPWNTHEPDRFSDESLYSLNHEMQKVAPNCEVRAVSLPLLSEDTSNPSKAYPTTAKQLGIFAIQDILPHETILYESSLLTANTRLHDPLCDACSSPLPSISVSASSLPSCPSCEDIIFCSSHCYSTALSRYHPAVCSKPDFDTLSKDPSPAAATNALYLLLLGRAFALAETQNLHPLDLPETKFLWGDFVHPESTYLHSSTAAAFSTARHLPFNFNDNILAPLHMLETMDIDIFASLPRCDTWVLNTMFAKFRGTASARLSTRDGRPEVCAVHPMWSLANHSCTPNVRWEWGGEIKFQARGREEMVRWGGDGGDTGKFEGGIKKGEEILNHYCDVNLGVRARREWAMGALGGMCVCERCVWEEEEEKRKQQGGRGEDGTLLCQLHAKKSD